jgi:hypothetical protein
MAKLETHGLMRPGERKGTWHINEDLMQTAAVAIAPQFAVLVRSVARGSSIVFYLADREITEVVVGDRALLAYLDDLGELCAEALKFLDKHFPAEVVVARVKGDGFDKGYKVEVGADGMMRAKARLQAEEQAEENAWTRENLEGFVRRALEGLGARLVGGS